MCHLFCIKNDIYLHFNPSEACWYTYSIYARSSFIVIQIIITYSIRVALFCYNICVWIINLNSIITIVFVVYQKHTPSTLTLSLPQQHLKLYCHHNLIQFSFSTFSFKLISHKVINNLYELFNYFIIKYVYYIVYVYFCNRVLNINESWPSFLSSSVPQIPTTYF